MAFQYGKALECEKSLKNRGLLGMKQQLVQERLWTRVEADLVKTWKNGRCKYLSYTESASITFPYSPKLQGFIKLGTEEPTDLNHD